MPPKLHATVPLLLFLASLARLVARADESAPTDWAQRGWLDPDWTATEQAEPGTGSAPAPPFDVDEAAQVADAAWPYVASAAVAITVDTSANRHPISPLIYGVAFASSSELAELNSPLNRSGGNSETRYNWQINAHNRAADWYFESLADSPATAGAAADKHIADSKAGGAEAMLTVPMIEWLPKLGPNRARLASYSIRKYGPQTDNDWQWFADAGNGVGTNAATRTKWLITTNNPSDANFQTNAAFQQEWIKHLTNRWGPSTNQGVRYYCMDNEHTLWHSTHRDVHPVGATMREIRDKFFDYAEKIKAVDPDAILLGPEEWGWSGYFWSGFDQQWSGARGDYNQSHYPDRSTNGGWDYLPWFLDQTHRRATNTGQRLLDVFTVHFYPQGGEFGNDTSTAMQLRRNQSTRALWDPNYVDQTWIGAPVKLIPRLRSWVTTYYPGTKIGVTEYNWGAEAHINGATAQADILGIFGREGLDMATRWTTPATTSPTFKAMKLFRNYDGKQSTFGDTSVAATGPNPDKMSTFAALRSADGALTLIAINKQTAASGPVDITLTNFLPGGTAEAWQLTSANVISRLPNASVMANRFSTTLPAQSVTLFVVPAEIQPRLRVGGMDGGGFSFWLDGQVGRRYAIQASGDLLGWAATQTNTLPASSARIVVSATNTQRFYRAQWLP